MKTENLNERKPVKKISFGRKAKRTQDKLSVAQVVLDNF